ncbi:hypothetical protein [Thermococcus aciditolerans]|nr:hypothetical protein [Thermococcus aciditolerans]
MREDVHCVFRKAFGGETFWGGFAFKVLNTDGTVGIRATEIMKKREA